HLRPARLPDPPRAHLAPLPRGARRRRQARRRRGAAARDRGADERRAVPGLHARRRGRAGPAAVRAGRRGGGAPAARALRAAVRHVAAGDLPAPRGVRRRQADARRPPARPRPRRPDQALLHLPQPRVPGLPAGDATRRGAGGAPVRLVLPGDQAQPAGVPAVGAAGARGAGGAVPPTLIRRAARWPVAVAGWIPARRAGSPAGSAWPSASAASLALRAGSPISDATGARSPSNTPSRLPR